MGEKCDNCRQRDEYLYWTKFQSQQFFRVLLEGFRLQFSIPSKFVLNLKEDLSRAVFLKGPSGRTWNVELMKTQDGLFFERGWLEFVKDHGLEVGNLLIFRYNGDSRFDVSIFDQGSLCEKESSYFADNCGCHVTRRTREDSVEVMPSPPRKVTRSTSSTKLRRRKPKPAQPSSQFNSSQAYANVGGRGSQGNVPVSAKRKSRREEPKPSDSSGDEAQLNFYPSYSLQLISNRRPVTKAEMERAHQLASAASSDHSFLVVMQPTHVYKRFFMTIPHGFVVSHFPKSNQDVILCIEESKWHVRFQYSTYRGSTGAFTGGWSIFVFQNNLEEGDVCLFELVGRDLNNIIINVRIFRVVEDVVPLTLLKTTPPKGRVTLRGRARGRPRKLL